MILFNEKIKKIQMILDIENSLLALFEEPAKLYKTLNDVYNRERLLIL